MAKTRSKKQNSKLSLVSGATEYFKEAVTGALEKQKVTVEQDTEFYLVDLLTRFMSPDSLFLVDESGGKRHHEVLALLMGEAMGSTNSGEKLRSLRRLGDISLYTAGFFQDSLARKIVDIDYYIDMGRTAYGSLATMGSAVELFRNAFDELSRQFPKFVDVLSEVSASSGASDPKNILRQYEVWLKTRSERAEKSLKEAGIIPNKLVKADWQ